MAFNNAANTSNVEFSTSSGTLVRADRTYLHPGFCENIGISYSGSTFTVQGADGNALSSTNPGYVAFNSKTNPGRLAKVSVTASETFVDDSGSSTIVGNTFGFGTGETATTTDIPFYLYAVINDSENAISFMISRQAGRTSSPAAADIGKTGSAIADNEWSFLLLVIQPLRIMTAILVS